jgi:2-polyprenyl-3-methyl-5-hydroxy-6-metoxy-1,4-benzoquinol methylase
MAGQDNGFMNAEMHWENVYGTKAHDQVSWFRPHLETSLSFIERSAADRSMRIIDVGGGGSTLVDDLLARNYANLTVLDISKTAIEVTKVRLAGLADRVAWLVADVTGAELPTSTYDVWHDRAVFHFLTTAVDRAAYVENVRKSVKPGGHVIIGTFGPEGPAKCSGLDVQRYDSDSLHGEFGTHFRLIDSLKELHQTPFGTTQQFLYCFCMVE